jgi:hypothetical protein
MRKWLALLTVAGALAHVQAQEQKPLADAGTVTCDSPISAGQISAWVNSGTGFAAAVELRQRITGAGTHRVCRSTWVLHVRKEGEKPHTVDVAQREDSPGDNEWTQENSFELEAWSASGNLLLVSQIEAAGDWDETTPIVYDFSTGSYRRIELAPIFGQMTRANCYVVYRPLRFDDDGSLVIEAMSTDDDRDPGTPACFPKRLWRFDLRTNTISRMRPQAPKPRLDSSSPATKPSPTPPKPRN